jgi:glycosyltransferase involved in cell wall biosynthesis
LKVAVDSWTLASRFRHHGTYVYARNLLAKFKEMSNQDPGLEFCLFASSNGANDANFIQPGRGFELAQTSLLERDRLWRLGGAGLAAARAGADLIFCPTTSILPIAAVPMVCTIHDVTAVKMPSHAPRVTLLLRWLLWWIAKFSRAIITDSECSRKDLIEIYGLPESKVSVIYLGYDKAVFNSEPAVAEQLQALRKRLNITRPYIVHHGTIQPRKNLQRLIATYRLLLSRNHDLDLDLVLAGNLGWECQEIVAAADASSGVGHVILPGVLGNADLALLVKGAELAVMPSLYEGFCLPMVECMACGTPTIAANTSCLPEISGGTLLYFDPTSVDDMADCMGRGLQDSGLRRDLIIGGTKRAGDFDWTRCAQETLDILKKHARNGTNG